MKNRNIYILFLFISLILTGCNKEETIEYTNNPPVLSLASEQITGKAGQNVKITGTMSDDLGLKFISLVSGGINLNRTIAISSRSEIINQYELDLTHRIPATATGAEYYIQVKLKNLTGQIVEKTITVTMQ